MSEAITLVDAHVHLPGTGDLGELLDGVADRLAAAAAVLGVPAWSGALLLAEMKSADVHQALRAGACPTGRWRLEAHAADPLCVTAVRDEHRLALVSGRQVVTSEGIEVLTLCTRDRVTDGQSLADTLAQARAAQAVIVLPWGAGKWLGRRGQLVADTLLGASGADLFAGDNGGRPRLWPAPALFRALQAARRPILSGSDPLPLPGEEQRIGAFGFWLRGLLDRERPGSALRDRLLCSTSDDVRAFGASMSAGCFVRNQVALRRAKTSGVSSPVTTTATGSGPERPDIETSSAGYASRFKGAAGRYLLDVQSRAILDAIRDIPPGTALDVGGGHGQLVDLLRSMGWRVTVHGTDPACEQNLRELHGKVDVPFLLGNLDHLPAADGSYDLVIAVRLLSHVDAWPGLVAEMCRVARRAVVVDYPSKFALNALTPLLFGLKKSLEGNTRTYTSFARSELAAAFGHEGFEVRRVVKQFFLPMVIHRVGKGAAPLRLAESLCRVSGLTALAGSPAILRADRR